LHQSIIVPDAGHRLRREAPDASNAALIDFLKSLV